VVQVLCTTGIIFGMWTSGALAANRYASPTGSGTSCNQATPCSIVTAISAASASDDVTIEPGTYGSHATPLSTPLTDSADITIHGQAGQSRPVIYTNANPGIGISHGSALSDVDVEDNNSSIRGSAIEVVSQPATIDHVIAHALGPNIEVGCTVIGSLVDSVCWSSGPNGYGVRVVDSGPFSQSATLRNDTLVATNTGGFGAVANSGGGWTVQMTLINSLAHGAGADVFVSSDPNPQTTVSVTADHANYATITEVQPGGTIMVPPAGSGTNQAAAPVFADPANGDFHELGSSPTIDAGADAALNGSTDLDGNLRELGAHTDIGAYEFVPPTPPSPTPPSPTPPSPTPPAPGHAAPVLSHTGYADTALTFDLSAAATVRFVFTERVPGRKVHGQCVAVTRHNRRHHGCSRTVTRGVLTVSGSSGSNTVHFTGRLTNRKKLPAGKYAVLLTATNGGGSSPTDRLSLTIR